MAGSTANGRGTVRVADVAARAGVAPGTASKALNGTGQLRDATRDRVLRAAAELGFERPAAARHPDRSFTVGLLTTDSIGRFTIPVMLGAEDALGAGDIAVLLCDTRDDPLRERHYLRTLAARRVDGVIVTGRRTDARPPIDVPMPAVYAFAPSSSEADISVGVDDAAGAQAVAAHLLGLGRRRVGHVTGPADHHSAQDRALALAGALGDGLAAEPLFGSWSEQWGRRGVDLLLERHPDLDAVVGGSDQIARGVCDRLRELGRRVPDDVAVAGFDDWDAMALASRPPLTTVALELEQVGRLAARLLIAAIDGEPDAGRHLVAPRLVVRESTIGR